jgi:hypothetical protein
VTTPTLAQEAVLSRIEEGGTHVFYTVEFVREIEEAFGVSVMQRLMANTGNFKGLQVEDVPENTEVEGASSHHVTSCIAASLGLSVPQFYGRGSQQRAELHVIRLYFGMESVL